MPVGPARVALLALGWLCVGLGVVGAVVPVLPTTPFLIGAAWAFSRSSRRFHDWLWFHPRYGPSVRAWRRHGVVPRRAKIAALSGMGISVAVLVLFVAEDWRLPALAGGVMAGVAAWIVPRPAHPPEEDSA
ncbi:MAG: YbaN family protein, partial [Alphaproteobacteria bacterium]|nr:YbaN family protein [Alphaproteobacteria bacterium]